MIMNFLVNQKNYEKHTLIDIVLKYVKKGPVLDVGCGNGNLLTLLKDKFDVEGFDSSKIAINLAKSRDLKVRINIIKCIPYHTHLLKLLERGIIK